jgi:hypothetical protein
MKLELPWKRLVPDPLGKILKSAKALLRRLFVSLIPHERIEHFYLGGKNKTFCHSEARLSPRNLSEVLASQKRKRDSSAKGTPRNDTGM